MKTETIYFGGGCFWCTEAGFRIVPGVLNITAGYSGGSVDNPTYEQVSTGSTGHAEVIKIEYDADQASFTKLLELFFTVHDASSLNRQGNDIGTQYRSIILFTNKKQQEEANLFINNLRGKGQKIVTAVMPFKEFWPAEEYHQDYYKKNPDASYSRAVVKPKVEKAKRYLNES